MKFKIALIVICGMLLHCGKKKSDDESPAPSSENATGNKDAPKEEPKDDKKVVASFDAALVGKWESTKDGAVETLNIDQSGNIVTNLTYDGQLILDVTQQSKTIDATTPKQMISAVTAIRLKPDQLELKVADMNRCIYGIEGNTLKMECSDTNVQAAPAAFTADASSYDRK